MPDINYPIETRTLANGLRVHVSEDHTTPMAALNLWVGVGSRHEAKGRTGFAHLFEHLMFQGSRNVANGEHFTALMGVGGRLNATTWFDRTNYFETLPVGALELALWLEADRHGYLLDAVNQANLDNQRDVVKEEKRQRYDNVPYGTALIDIYATAFPEEHPYHHPTIGSMADLDAATVEDVHNFFKEHYGPNNTVLTIVGDVEADKAFDLVERYFGGLPASATPHPEVSPQLAPLGTPARLVKHEDVPNDRLYLAFRLPVDATDDYLASAVGFGALGGLASSRLVNRLVRQEESATSIHAHTLGLIDGTSLGLISADVSAGVDPAAVEAAITEELAGFVQSGPTDVELASVLADTERGWLTELADIEDRTDHISHFSSLANDPAYINTLVSRVGAITADDVTAAAAQWMQPESRAVIEFRQETSA